MSVSMHVHIEGVCCANDIVKCVSCSNGSCRICFRVDYGVS